MSDHQFIVLMIFLQTVGFAISISYLANILHKVSADTRYIIDAVDKISKRLA
jgi:hypothetical protein